MSALATILFTVRAIPTTARLVVETGYFQVLINTSFVIIFICVSNLPVPPAAAIVINIWIEFSETKILAIFTTLKHILNAAYVYFVFLPMCISPSGPHIKFFWKVHVGHKQHTLDQQQLRTLNQYAWPVTVFGKSNGKSDMWHKNLHLNHHHNFVAIHHLHKPIL